jgi:hypothetical protein
MTCIVGYLDKETVYLGGDSAGTDGNYSQHIRKDKKVFQNGPFIFGFTSSFRMGQILMSSRFKPWRQKAEQSDYDYMVVDFIDAVRKAFEKGGYLQKTTEGDEVGGTFLVGYKGVLYYVEDDFQVGIVADKYLSIGCGSDLALGALYSLSQTFQSTLDKAHPKSITDIYLTKALDAASHFSAGCAPPYNFVSMTKEESVEEIKKLELRPVKSKTKKKKK